MPGKVHSNKSKDKLKYHNKMQACDSVSSEVGWGMEVRPSHILSG
jgi:hypothetical protein